jgi:predicted DNA-binding transcriptional regulator AlpA
METRLDAKPTAAEQITLTEEQFCQQVGISRTTAWRMRNAGKLPYCRIGDKVLYLPRHIDEFLSRMEKRASAKAR